MLAFTNILVFFLFLGVVLSRSIGNSTLDEGKSVTDMLERLIRNLTELETKIEKPPVFGVYMFSWTIQTYSTKGVNTELRVDNVVQDTLNTNLGSTTGRVAATRVVVCNVMMGDHVWIQTSGYFTENVFDYDSASQSSFMGILLYET